jgi:hypothetical protein
MGREPPRVGAQAPDRDLAGGDAQLDLLPGADQPPRQRIRPGLERDQTVLADPAQVPLGDHIGAFRQRSQRRPVTLSAHCDHLAVGAVHLPASDRQPGREGGVHLLGRAEAAAGEHTPAHAVDPALHPAFRCGRCGAASQIAKS